MDRLELLKSYLEKAPEDSFLNHALALEYIKGGHDEEAIRIFQMLLKRDPDYVGSYYHLGSALERAGDPAGAKVAYQDGISVARRLGEAHALQELQQAADELED